MPNADLQKKKTLNKVKLLLKNTPQDKFENVIDSC